MPDQTDHTDQTDQARAAIACFRHALSALNAIPDDDPRWPSISDHLSALLTTAPLALLGEDAGREGS